MLLVVVSLIMILTSRTGPNDDERFEREMRESFREIGEAMERGLKRREKDY